LLFCVLSLPGAVPCPLSYVPRKIETHDRHTNVYFTEGLRTTRVFSIVEVSTRSDILGLMLSKGAYLLRPTSVPGVRLEVRNFSSSLLYGRRAKNTSIYRTSR